MHSVYHLQRAVHQADIYVARLQAYLGVEPMTPGGIRHLSVSRGEVLEAMHKMPIAKCPAFMLASKLGVPL